MLANTIRRKRKVVLVQMYLEEMKHLFKVGRFRFRHRIGRWWRQDWRQWEQSKWGWWPRWPRWSGWPRCSGWSGWWSASRQGWVEGGCLRWKVHRWRKQWREQSWSQWICRCQRWGWRHLLWGSRYPIEGKISCCRWIWEGKRWGSWDATTLQLAGQVGRDLNIISNSLRSYGSLYCLIGICLAWLKSLHFSETRTTFLSSQTCLLSYFHSGSKMRNRFTRFTFLQFSSVLNWAMQTRDSGPSGFMTGDIVVFLVAKRITLIQKHNYHFRLPFDRNAHLHFSTTFLGKTLNNDIAIVMQTDLDILLWDIPLW